VLSVDPDLAAAEATTDLVRAARVGAWTLQADLADEADLQMLAARAADLGGTDLLVDAGRPPVSVRLTGLLVEGLTERRGARDRDLSVVRIGPGADGGSSSRARVMAVLPVGLGPEPAAPLLTPELTLAVTRAVLDLLRHGYDGQVVELAGPTDDRQPPAQA
jgi:hypothetical protein